MVPRRRRPERHDMTPAPGGLTRTGPSAGHVAHDRSAVIAVRWPLGGGPYGHACIQRPIRCVSYSRRRGCKTRPLKVREMAPRTRRTWAKIAHVSSKDPILGLAHFLRYLLPKSGNGEGDRCLVRVVGGYNILLPIGSWSRAPSRLGPQAHLLVPPAFCRRQTLRRTSPR